MALLTAVILGGVMVAVLGAYYWRAEESYLKAAGNILAADPPPLTTTEDLSQWARAAALATSTRVRIVSGDGVVVVDSGSPSDLSADELLRLGGGEGPGHHGYEGRLPQPLGGGLFGGSGGRSSRSMTLPITGTDGAYVRISEAPASGRDALISAVQAWILAAALAVVAAALAGYLVAARIARPVVALTAASDRMAEGDLGARADVDRDDEVGRLAESFNVMAGRIQGTVTTLRRFVADAAHEIGTPLTALRADLELAQRTSATPDERRVRGPRPRTGAAPGGALREPAAALAAGGRRRHGGRSRGRRAAGPPGGRCGRLQGRAGRGRPAPRHRRRPAHRPRLDGRAADGARQPAGQRHQVHPGRGRRHAARRSARSPGLPPGRPAAPVPAPVVITVADTGVGIPATEQAEIFGRFHRARNVAAYPGNGLGLAIVKAAVERSGGEVTFTSSEAGTEFRVTLPPA